MKKELIIEKLSGHETSGKIGKIQKNIGDLIHKGDTLFTIESGKGALAYKSDWEGVLTALLVEEGQIVQKGQAAAHLEMDALAEAASKEPENVQKQTVKPAAGYSFGIAKPVKTAITVDVAIIGGGPGGYVAAIRAAQSGLKVAIIEEDRLGGTCLNYGCIPTKAMSSSVAVLNQIKNASLYGFDVSSVAIQFDQVIARKNQVVDQLVGGIEYLMNVHEIEYIKGTAVIEPDGSISVKNKKAEWTIEYKNLILAMGSSPCSIPIEGHDLPDVLTSRELLSLEKIPKSLTIIGGGVIGMEFAFIYNALGTDVTVVEYYPQILNLLDEDVVQVIRESAVHKGIKLYEGACAASIKNTLDGSKLIEIQIEENHHYICTKKVDMAMGRKANLNSVNLDILGVELNEQKNGISVNEYLQTNKENIYAIGDVTNIIQLAHVASHQGMVAADHISGGKTPMDYSAVPSAIFTNPEIGHVGLTEREAAQQGIETISGKFPFAANGKALAMGEAEGFVKIIADAQTRVILGGTAVGIHATDLLATLGNLVTHSTTIDQAAHVIYAHPTTSEAIHEALLLVDNRGIHFA